MFQVEELKKALEDKAFAEEYSKSETVKEAVAVLAKKGLECTEEEFATVVKAVKVAQEKNGELDDAALEGVAGGFNFTSIPMIMNNPELLPKPVFMDPVIIKLPL